MATLAFNLSVSDIAPDGCGFTLSASDGVATKSLIGHATFRAPVTDPSQAQIALEQAIGQPAVSGGIAPLDDYKALLSSQF